MKAIAHISDLHIGRKVFEKPIKKLVNSLIENEIDHVILTGDITESGTEQQYEFFLKAFKPLLYDNKITMVVGNHDRLNDNIGRYIMSDRVILEVYNNTYIIRVDSTGPHNRRWIYGHGIICDKVLTDIKVAINSIPQDSLIVLAIHHHPIHLPMEDLFERVSSYLGYPFAKELHLGKELLEVLKPRVDLLLFGHKHIEYNATFPNSKLAIYNAGCTPRYNKYRVFTYKNISPIREVRWASF